MKKLLSLALSLGLCVSGITALTSNAEIIDGPDLIIIVNEGIPTYLQPCDKLNEYFDFTPGSYGYVYKNVNLTTNVRYCLAKSFNNDNNAIALATMLAEFTTYRCASTEEAESVEAYINEKYPSFSTEITKNGDLIEVKVSGDAFEALSYEEQFEVAKDIKANTGVKVSPRYLVAPAKNAYSIGDTDMDGEITISDAAQIMSFVTNKKQSPLSEMSQIVGDIYNTGDGINNMDALQIQRILANVE